jgi:hypothetical protein
MQVQGNRLYDSSLNEKIRKTLAGEDCSDGEGDAKKDKKDKKDKKEKKDDKKEKKDKKETKDKKTKGKSTKKDISSQGTSSSFDRFRYLLSCIPIFRKGERYISFQINTHNSHVLLPAAAPYDA